MANKDAKIEEVGSTMAASLYANAKFDAGDVPPYFMLHKDTIRTFLHEKKQLLSAEGRLLGLIGVEVALVLAILTSTFHDYLGIPGTQIGAAFLVFSMIGGWLTVKETWVWVRTRKESSVDSLVDDLGKRGAAIRP